MKAHAEWRPHQSAAFRDAVVPRSLNPLDTSEILIDLKFAAGAQLSRPFSLDLADAFAALETPDFIADFVGVDASGTLSLDADGGSLAQ